MSIIGGVKSNRSGTAPIEAIESTDQALHVRLSSADSAILDLLRAQTIALNEQNDTITTLLCAILAGIEIIADTENLIDTIGD